MTAAALGEGEPAATCRSCAISAKRAVSSGASVYDPTDSTAAASPATMLGLADTA